MKNEKLVAVLLESLEERNIEATEEMVEEFLDEYIDSELIEIEDVVVSESILDELSEYVESFDYVVDENDEDEDDEDEDDDDLEEDLEELDYLNN